MAKPTWIEKIKIKRAFLDAIDDINPARIAELFSKAYAEDPEFALSAIEKPMRKLCEKSEWKAIEELFDAGAREPHLVYMAIVKKAPSEFFKKIIDDRESRQDPSSDTHERRGLRPIEISIAYESFRKFLVPEPALCAISGNAANLSILLENLLDKARRQANADGSPVRETPDFRLIEDSLAFVDTAKRTYLTHIDYSCMSRLHLALERAEAPPAQLPNEQAGDESSFAFSADSDACTLAKFCEAVSEQAPASAAVPEHSAFESLLLAKLEEMSKNLGAMNAKVEGMSQEIADLRSRIPDSPKSLLDRLRPTRAYEPARAAAAVDPASLRKP